MKMTIRLMTLAVIGSTGLINTVSGFTLTDYLPGGKTDEAVDAAPPRRDLVKEFGGEEAFKLRLANAFDLEKPEMLDESLSLEYGVDISYPIHNAKVSKNYEWLPHNSKDSDVGVPYKYKGMPTQPLGDVQSRYDENIQGCRDRYKNQAYSCDATESERIAMNLRQPKSMQNYTDFGFKKIRAPAELMEMLTEFYETNYEREKIEKWPPGNTYTNHWKVPTHMLNVEDITLRGGGTRLKNRIWDAARSTLEGWTGEQLTPCSLYGIRVYKEGSILAPHVDRLPLVASAIINVAQDVDEDWPIEVYAHDGRAYNITMQPGDMVLYESHSVVHGRPFPLKGRFYANVFIHFEPTGHSLRHEKKMKGESAEELYTKARKAGAKKTSKGEDDDYLPPYIIKGTPEEKRWRSENSIRKNSESASFAKGSTNAHQAASFGEVAALEQISKKDEKLLHDKDENGWMPLHEAARSGHSDAVKFLVEKGSDINARTNMGKGGTVLWWASKSNGEKHPVVKYLKKLGALDLGPEDRKSVV